MLPLSLAKCSAVWRYCYIQTKWLHIVDTAPESLLTSEHKGVLNRVGADRASSMVLEVNAQAIVCITLVLTKKERKTEVKRLRESNVRRTMPS